VFSTEFTTYPKKYYDYALRTGLLTVNGCKVTKEYVIQQHDKILHTLHRHEPPVRSLLESSILQRTSELIAVSKPSCIPCHPCGSYHYNSVMSVLPTLVPGGLAVDTSKRDKNLHGLFPVYRLDRLTSGVLITGLTKDFSSRMGRAVQGGEVEKYYVVRCYGRIGKGVGMVGVEDMYRRLRASVDGEKVFKGCETIVVDRGTSCVDATKGVYVCGTREEVEVKRKGLGLDGVGDFKECKTVLVPFCYDAESDTTLVVAQPKTGRTHQIRLHCEYVGHGVVHDPNYGRGKEEAKKKEGEEKEGSAGGGEDGNEFMMSCGVEEWDEMMGRICGYCGVRNEVCECDVTKFVEDREKLNEFVQKNCVFCLRRTNEKALKEYEKRCKGICLHAVKYVWSAGKVDVVDEWPEWVVGWKGREEEGQLIKIE
jgi:23S rRNA-/tRNA-specific pseudouridylate synthase